MKVEFKETLEKELREGINLFLGAGFSIHAKNFSNLNLPVASYLSEELITHFNCPDIKDLSKICTIIDSYNSEGLRTYLINRFNVSSYESFYSNLLSINAPRIFTTNIDNLVNKIFENNISLS